MPLTSFLLSFIGITYNFPLLSFIVVASIRSAERPFGGGSGNTAFVVPLAVRRVGFPTLRVETILEGSVSDAFPSLPQM